VGSGFKKAPGCLCAENRTWIHAEKDWSSKNVSYEAIALVFGKLGFSPHRRGFSNTFLEVLLAAFVFGQSREPALGTKCRRKPGSRGTKKGSADKRIKNSGMYDYEQIRDYHRL